MGFSFFPKNDRFFDLFSRSAGNICTAAEHFVGMVEDFTDVESKAERIKELETKGDAITHEIIEYLNASFITPIDREDIFALAGNLDEVLDEIEGVASRMVLFAVDKPTLECVELGRLLLRGAGLIEKAVANLKSSDGLKEFLVAINSLENQADQITRATTARLFDGAVVDMKTLIKWKEIYARLEHTADRMEDVANVIEDIAVKNG